MENFSDGDNVWNIKFILYMLYEIEQLTVYLKLK